MASDSVDLYSRVCIKKTDSFLSLSHTHYYTHTRANLQASWEGPFRVTKHIPPLNYEVEDIDATWSKVIHINNIRTYQPLPQLKPVTVHATCLVAEETTELAHALSKTPSLVGGSCLEYSQREMDTLLKKNEDVFSSTPGEAHVKPFQITL